MTKYEVSPKEMGFAGLVVVLFIAQVSPETLPSPYPFEFLHPWKLHVCTRNAVMGWLSPRGGRGRGRPKTKIHARSTITNWSVDRIQRRLQCTKSPGRGTFWSEREQSSPVKYLVSVEIDRNRRVVESPHHQAISCLTWKKERERERARAEKKRTFHGSWRTGT